MKLILSAIASALFFLGANIDAAAEAKRFGIDESRAANYHCDEEGTALNYEVISEATKKGADLAKNSAKSAPECLGR